MLKIFQQKQSKDNILGRRKGFVPKSAQDAIPFIEVYENGLFLTEENTYTLIFSFKNID